MLFFSFVFMEVKKKQSKTIYYERKLNQTNMFLAKLTTSLQEIIWTQNNLVCFYLWAQLKNISFHMKVLAWQAFIWMKVECIHSLLGTHMNCFPFSMQNRIQYVCNMYHTMSNIIHTFEVYLGIFSIWNFN